MSFVDFKTLKDTTSITDVLSWLGIGLKPSPNGQLRGCCPIHKGSSPREFVVTPSKGLYFCFGGCGGGDIIKLVGACRGIEQKAAAQQIAAHFGSCSVTGPWSPTVRRPGTVTQNEKGALKPLDYLQTQHEAVQALGAAPDTCGHFGAGFAPKGILRGRLAIPIHSKDGVLLAYCGRTVKGESPTLTFPNGFQPADVIFNANRITSGELYLVRDPLQVLTAYESGIENVVSFLTEAISAQQLEMMASLLDEFKCESVVLF